MNYKIPVNGVWKCFDDAWLLQLEATGRKKEAEQVRALIEQYEANRLAYFLAHGGGLDFLNDHESELSILLSGIQDGKTYTGAAWLSLRTIPCDPSWPCFKHHGIKHIPFTNPVDVGIASYEMSVHCRRKLWPTLREILPVHELRDYSPHWKPRDGRLKMKTPNWQSAPSIPLACGSRMDFYAYKQAAEAFTSMSYRAWHFDEQVPEEHFDNAHDRGATMDNFQIAITATPHRVPGRPDTGAGGWIHKLVLGARTKGITFKVYKIKVEDVPDAIKSAKKKQSEYKKFIEEPRASGVLARIRAGESKWFGDFEYSEGLVYDNWNRSMQWIDPFPIPSTWTLVRGVDPGQKVPFAVLWAAMTPWGDMVLYREYYEAGLGMAENVRRTIAMSGNRREEIGKRKDQDGNTTVMFQEVQDKEHYLFTVMDGRTFAQPSSESMLTQGDIFAQLGLRCIPASGAKGEQAIPIVREWLEPIPGREHLLVRMKLAKEILGYDKKPVAATPKLYVFNTLHSFRGEIESYVHKPDSEKPVDKDDHLLSALRYAILANPRYRGPIQREDPVDYSAPSSRFAYR